MENTRNTTPPADAPKDRDPETQDPADKLGYLELLRAEPDPEPEPSATDRVLNHSRQSAWDF